MASGRSMRLRPSALGRCPPCSAASGTSSTVPPRPTCRSSAPGSRRRLTGTRLTATPGTSSGVSTGANTCRSVRPWPGWQWRWSLRAAGWATRSWRSPASRRPRWRYPKGASKSSPTASPCPRSTTAPPPTDPADVVYVGRLIDEKRVDLLLDAAARLRQRVPGVTYSIIGIGPRGGLAAGAGRAHGSR